MTPEKCATREEKKLATTKQNKAWLRLEVTWPKGGAEKRTEMELAVSPAKASALIRLLVRPERMTIDDLVSLGLPGIPATMLPPQPESEPKS